jgi:hypothetical protein
MVEMHKMLGEHISNFVVQANRNLWTLHNGMTRVQGEATKEQERMKARYESALVENNKKMINVVSNERKNHNTCVEYERKQYNARLKKAKEQFNELLVEAQTNIRNEYEEKRAVDTAHIKKIEADHLKIHNKNLELKKALDDMAQKNVDLTTLAQESGENKRKYHELQKVYNASCVLLNSSLVKPIQPDDEHQIKRVSGIRLVNGTDQSTPIEDRFEYQCYVDARSTPKWMELTDLTPLETFLVNEIRDKNLASFRPAKNLKSSPSAP